MIVLNGFDGDGLDVGDDGDSGGGGDGAEHVPELIVDNDGSDGGAGELVPEVIVGSKLYCLLWSDQQDVHPAPSVHAKVALTICSVLVLLVG